MLILNQKPTYTVEIIERVRP